MGERGRSDKGSKTSLRWRARRGCLCSGRRHSISRPKPQPGLGGSHRDEAHGGWTSGSPMQRLGVDVGLLHAPRLSRGATEEVAGVMQLRGPTFACPIVGGADLTCVRSAVRRLAPPVYPAGYLHRPELVLSADLGISNGALVDPTEQELGNYDVARVDPTEQVLENCNAARVDPTEHELGNCNAARVDPTEHELGNYDVSRVDPTEYELRNCDVARVDPTEQELGNCNVGLSPRMKSGANPEIWPRGRSRAQIRRFGRDDDLRRKFRDFGREVSSGANPEIWPRGRSR
ncbi:hypothetical protein B296_00055720, partial [Ensete ventricosum]